MVKPIFYVMDRDGKLFNVSAKPMTFTSPEDAQQVLASYEDSGTYTILKAVSRFRLSKTVTSTPLPEEENNA